MTAVTNTVPSASRFPRMRHVACTSPLILACSRHSLLFASMVTNKQTPSALKKWMFAVGRNSGPRQVPVVDLHEDRLPDVDLGRGLAVPVDDADRESASPDRRRGRCRVGPNPLGAASAPAHVLLHDVRARRRRRSGGRRRAGSRAGRAAAPTACCGRRTARCARRRSAPPCGRGTSSGTRRRRRRAPRRSAGSRARGARRPRTRAACTCRSSSA